MVGHTLLPSWRHARRESWAGLSSLQWYDTTTTTTTTKHNIIPLHSLPHQGPLGCAPLSAPSASPPLPDQVPAMPDFSGWTARIKVPHLFLLLNYIMV